MERPSQEDIEAFRAYLLRRAALLNLLREGYIDQDILDLFWTSEHPCPVTTIHDPAVWN